MKLHRVRHFAIVLIAVLTASGFSSPDARAQDSLAYWVHKIEVPPSLGEIAVVGSGIEPTMVTTETGSGLMLSGSIVTEPDGNRLFFIYDHSGCIDPDSTYADRDPNSPLYDPNPTDPILGKVWTLDELVGPLWLAEHPELNNSSTNALSGAGISSTGLAVGYVWDSAVDPSGLGRDTRLPVYLDLTDPILELKLVPTPSPRSEYDRIGTPTVSDTGDIHLRLEEWDSGNPLVVQSYLYKPARNGDPAESILLPDLGVSFARVNAMRQLIGVDDVNEVIVRYTLTDTAGNGIVDEIPMVQFSTKGRPGSIDWELRGSNDLNNFGQFTAQLNVYGGDQEKGKYEVRYGGPPGNLIEERRWQPPAPQYSYPRISLNDSGDTSKWDGVGVLQTHSYYEGSAAEGDEVLVPRIEDLIIPESDPTGLIAENGLHYSTISNRDSTGFGWIVGYSNPESVSTRELHILQPIVPSAEPGILVNPVAGLITTEAGDPATFDIVLNTEPAADVTVGISSSNTDEGTTDVASLTFTPTNWDTPQTVTITGVDDAIEDGDVSYTILTAVATSSDPDYDGLDADDVSVTNEDDDGQSGGGSETYDATDIPQGGLDIPDNDPLGESSTIEDVPDLPYIGLTVTLDISHPRPSDLEVWLVPDANSTDQAVQLFNFTGQNDVTDDFTSSFGDWTLEVYDTRKKRTGTLNGWSITIDY